MTGEEAINKFLDEIITEKKLPGMNEEVKQMLIEDMKGRLLDQINRAILDAMPEEKVNEFNNFLDQSGKSDDDVQKFISECGVDIKAVTARTVLRFRDLYLQTNEERRA